MRARLVLALSLAALAPPAHAAEGFTARTTPIPPALEEPMTGTTWHPTGRCGARVLACPPLSDLVLITASHRDFGGASRTGQVVVAREAAPRVRLLLEALWHLRFPLTRLWISEGTWLAFTNPQPML